MSTLPLYLRSDAVPHANGWRDVRIPGGYEYWRFDVRDAADEIRLLVLLSLGYFGTAGYQRRHHRYIRRPTRHAPPISTDEPSVYVALARVGQRRIERMIRAEGPWKPADPLTIQIAGVRLSLDGDDMALDVTPDVGLAASLQLRPTYVQPFQDHILAGELDGQEQGLCTCGGGHFEAKGMIGIARCDAPFAGRATHRHAWGLPGPSTSTRLAGLRMGH